VPVPGPRCGLIDVKRLRIELRPELNYRGFLNRVGSRGDDLTHGKFAELHKGSVLRP
jgi:hypothetical protein